MFVSLVTYICSKYAWENPRFQISTNLGGEASTVRIRAKNIHIFQPLRSENVHHISYRLSKESVQALHKERLLALLFFSPQDYKTIIQNSDITINAGLYLPDFKIYMPMNLI